jgi:hypothetical protein
VYIQNKMPANYKGEFNNDDSFTMNGGIISGNSATSGGGVSINYYTLFTLVDGTISGNTAGYGGGIDISNASIFIQAGGTISGNTASGYGGGVSDESPGGNWFSCLEELLPIPI